MQIPIINIGTSKGIIIPAFLLKEYGITNAVEVEKLAEGIMLKPFPSRESWDKSFAKHSSPAGEPLLDGYTPTKFDEEEWEW